MSILDWFHCSWRVICAISALTIFSFSSPVLADSLPVGSVSYSSGSDKVYISVSDPDHSSTVRLGTYIDVPGGRVSTGVKYAHGGSFTYTIPSQFRDGNTHTLNIYAVDIKPDGSAPGTPYVNLGPVSIVVYPKPTASISWSPSTVDYGGTSTLSWSSSNATSCTRENGSSSSTGGSWVGSNRTRNITVSLTCSGPGGTSSTSYSTLTVNPLPKPTVSLYWSPSSIAYGGSSTLYWGSSNASTCYVNGIARGTSGSLAGNNMTSGRNSSAYCEGAGGTSSTDYATLTVGPKPNSAPSVNGNMASSFAHNDPVVASATASDSDGSIQYVRFHLYNSSNNHITSITDYSSGYSANFGSLSPGSYRVLVRAVDDDGAIDYHSGSEHHFTVSQAPPEIISAYYQPSVGQVGQTQNYYLSWNNADRCYAESAYGTTEYTEQYPSGKAISRSRPFNYNFTVTCENSAGSVSRDVQLRVDFSNQPYSVSYSQGTLAWHGISGANEYVVERSVNDAGWTSIATTSDVSVSNLSKSPADKVAYRVKGCYADSQSPTELCSGYSEVVTLNPIPVPEIATAHYVPSVAKVGDTQQYYLSWNNADNCYAESVYGRTDYAQGHPDVTDITRNRPYNYTFTVTCENARTSTSVDVLLKVDFNGKPESVIYNQGMLSWDAVESANQYKVERQIGDQTWVEVATVPTTSVDGLSIPDTNEVVKFRVKACYEDSLSPNELCSEYSDEFTVISKPVIVKAYYQPATVAVGESQTYYLEWEGAESCKATSVYGTTDYEQQHSSGIVIERARPYNYTFTVSCENQRGSVSQDVLLKVDLTGRPESLTFNNQVLSWTAVDYANQYQVEQKLADGSWETVVTSMSNSIESFVLPDVAGIVKYRVRACYEDDLSPNELCTEYSESLSVEPRKIPVVTAYYEPEIGIVGQPQTYFLDWKNADSCYAQSEYGTTNYQQPYSDGLVIERDRPYDYTFTVICTNQSGKQTSTDVELKVNYDPAVKPVIHTAEYLEDNTLRLIWDQLAGSNLYEVETKSSGGEWGSLSTTTTNFIEDSNSVSGTQYRIRGCYDETSPVSRRICGSSTEFTPENLASVVALTTDVSIITVGQTQTFTLEYSNAARCYTTDESDFDKQVELDLTTVDNGSVPGSKVVWLAAKPYKSGSRTLAVACENSAGLKTAARVLATEVTVFSAPKNFKVND